MGNLLSSAIKMQSSNGGANPTLVINFTDYAGGASVDVYKNGAFFDTAFSGTPLTVLIVAGNTFYLQITAPNGGGFIAAEYFINAVSQGTQTTTTSLATTTRTASGTNAYSYTVVADVF